MTTNVARLRERLHDAFGFQTFRPGQSKACQAAIAGRDTLVLMPTGSGKSLCYQLPGLELEGVTVVVSPLLALAEDQAASLKDHGIEAVIFNSSKSASQTQRFREEVRSGKTEFVFTTPEQLQRTDLCEMLADVGVDLFVIDEAHCVSQWGHDFRPDYLCLHHARQRLGEPPILAMTATASSQTIEEIVSCLRLIDPVTVSSSIYRSNLRLEVVSCQGHQAKDDHLRDLLNRDDFLVANEPAIVYSNTIKETERLAADFEDLSIPVHRYHGGLNKAERLASQAAFMDGPASVMFATNAFGLGIDKPDIRRVVHYHLPASLEAYYQEVGRAGRDGKQSNCTLLFDAEDLRVLKMFAGGHLDSSQLATAHHCLNQGTQRFANDDGTVSLTDLKKISPLGRQTLKSCLQQLASRGLVVPAGRGRWRCIVDTIDHSVTDRLADEGRQRSENRRIALQQMVRFATEDRCRWNALFEHFEEEPNRGTIACCCDVCEPPSNMDQAASEVAVSSAD
ncbi:ATP-dependent DNA helicase RecQ [Neorhodopirellula lusitana]|uniref:ATP-dependent DNA helicase RecQ n=1 Tax=Neorhodopirellula lusitana TaxID=445327 RepID=A0ABY1Q6S2_9BACT|nr:RecQ family ATP-dependent DNA helicase [Neorhodopirellula lusitana]SMP61487.1 ATP-dependent DNA helicase RecQ [Neorhodopirellula lusitana]